MILTRDDAMKRKKSDVKEAYKHSVLLSERNVYSKLNTLKFVLFIITSCTVLSLLYSPIIQCENPSQLNSWSRAVNSSSTRQKNISDHPYESHVKMVNAGSLGQKNVSDPQYEFHVDIENVSSMTLKNISDPRYVSPVEINWEHLPNVLQHVQHKDESLRVGLVNFDVDDVSYWHKIFPQSDTSLVDLDYANPNITWSHLYPEWIDEEEENEVPVCPSLPEPQVNEGSAFDLIAVKLPCNKSATWSRDVPRLHLQLAAAKLAQASAKQNLKTYILFITDCFPVPNLFTCKGLVKREGNAWLYKPDMKEMQQKLELPIGSCKLAVPLKANDQSVSTVGHREAYATILHSADDYVCGAIAAAQSIRMAGSTRDLVILVDKSISNHHRTGLEAAGWKVRVIERIRNPKAEKDAYNEWNYSKFRLWQLTDYDKIIFIDADLLILRNIDFLFKMPEITATGNDATLFNSGVMVIEPSNCTFKLLMEHINEITSYNGGDQGYLNEIFTWWHRIPKQMNFLKHFWVGDTEEIKSKKRMLYGADPPVLYVIHYLGLKPWLCFRDYDCNFNSQRYRDYASDEAHATWWKVHEAMPENLQNFCLLSSYRKAHLEFNRRKAKQSNFPDGHWKRNITDPRKDICSEKFCNWEKMLANWKDTSS